MCRGCVEAGYLSGWVAEVLEEHEDRYPEDAFGGSHIVVGDWNVDDGSVLYCLRQGDTSDTARSLLRWLATVPLVERIPPRPFYAGGEVER